MNEGTELDELRSASPPSTESKRDHAHPNQSPLQRNEHIPIASFIFTHDSSCFFNVATNILSPSSSEFTASEMVNVVICAPRKDGMGCEGSSLNYSG